MTKEQISKKKTYDMSFEEAQEYIIKCGFAVPWNDGDVFVDEREITRTVGNVLKWRIESLWHKPTEEPLHSELCLIQLKNNTFRLAYSAKFKGEQPYFEDCFMSRTYDMDGIKHYCYIKDLLPEDNK